MISCIRTVSYNCKNFISSVDEIRELCQVFDVIFLQETWLMDSELYKLSQVDSNFLAQGVSSMDTSNQLIRGRPYGGLAILWSKHLGCQCKPVIFKDNNMFMALEISVAGVKHLFINVYLPYCYIGNLDLFLSCLSEMDSIITAASTPYVYFIGDFNADLSKDHLFGSELKSFCSDMNLIISDKEHLGDSYTFLSSAHDSVSWLDHVVCTNSAHALMRDYKVLYDKVSSDHFPLSMTIDIQLQSAAVVNDVARRDSRVNWDKLTEPQIQKYTDFTKLKCDCVFLSQPGLLC